MDARADFGAETEPRSIATSERRPSGHVRRATAVTIAPATSAGSGVETPCCCTSFRRIAHVARAARGRERLAEMLGDLGMPAAAALGEGDDALDASVGLAGVPLEQIVDDGACVRPDLGEVDLHQPAGVVTAAHDPGLLEHADEHARVVIARGELRRIDAAAVVSDRSVDVAKVVRLGDVAHREATHRRRIRRAREEQRRARPAVAAAAADHLHVALERVGVVEEADEAHVRLVDSHAERGCRDDSADPAGDEVVLDAGSLIGLEARVVVLQRESVAAQRAGDSLTGVAGARVDDGAALADRSKPLDEDPKPVLVASDPLDVVAKVGANDARSHDGHLAAESGGNAGGGRGCRGRRHAEHRRLSERLEGAPDEEVVGSEVVAPHAHAMHLVDHDEADADRAQRLDERGVAETLGGRVAAGAFARP